jgi:spermidine/putrescine-binding protein
MVALAACGDAEVREVIKEVPVEVIKEVQVAGETKVVEVEVPGATQIVEVEKVVEVETVIEIEKLIEVEKLVTPPPTVSACQDATLSFIGLAGEEGDVELAAWREGLNTALEGSWPGNWSELIASIKVGNVYDLVTIPYHWAQRMIVSGILQPLDTSRLSNWDDMVPGLRENSSLRGPDGTVYGAPIAWGDGPYVYHPARVESPPTSILDMMEPEWKDRFVLFDAPALVYFLLGIANGSIDVATPDAPLITPEELDAIVEQAAVIVGNASAFNTGYQDATDRLVAGDIDLAMGGWEAMLTWAAEKGVKLDFGFFQESAGGWWDGLAIPVTADDVDCAYEYIDMMLSPDVQAQVATNLISATVNRKSIGMIEVSAQIYDYSIVLGEDTGAMFKNATPPEDPGEGYTSYQDWLDAWQAIKAG